MGYRTGKQNACTNRPMGRGTDNHYGADKRSELRDLNRVDNSTRVRNNIHTNTINTMLYVASSGDDTEQAKRLTCSN